jgi:D-alanine-D-alanine ligase
VTQSLQVVLLYNAPLLGPNDADFASEASVLETVAAMGQALRGAGHRVSEIATGQSIAETAQQLERSNRDVVVNLCEGFFGLSSGEAHMASVLELLRVPYTGSAPDCLALTHNKPRTKQLLTAAGINTPEYLEVCRGHALPESVLQQWLADGPLIVKPAHEDASLGIGAESVVRQMPALKQQVQSVHHRYGSALIERYIAGREFNVGIIELPDLKVLPIPEIEFQPAPELPWPILTYAAKWSAGSPEDLSSRPRCPANVEPLLAQALSSAALAVYRITGCRDYARVDLRADIHGRVHVLEINANPDIGPNSGFARMLRAAGIGMDEFANRLLETTQARHSMNDADAVVSEAKPTCENDQNPSHEPVEVHVRAVQTEDRATLIEITCACGVFRPDEIEIADEVLGEALQNKTGGDYRVLVAETMGRTVGWSCHGRVPLTDATFDLYWIAVVPDMQGRGIGHKLLSHIESEISAAGGRWLLAETSSTAAYRNTHRFYDRCGFQAVSYIADFYRPGDGRLTFGKRVGRR